MSKNKAYQKGKNGQTKKSWRKGKKLAVYMDGKWHHFGAKGYSDYPKHKNKKRRSNYRKRHAKNMKGNSSRAKAFRVYNRKKWQEGGEISYATSPYEYQMGLLAGVNGFKFSDVGPHRMTMKPQGVIIPTPIRFEGYDGNLLVDSGIAYPGEDFIAEGTEIREYPMYSKYQTGGRIEPGKDNRLIRAISNVPWPLVAHRPDLGMPSHLVPKRNPDYELAYGTTSPGYLPVGHPGNFRLTATDTHPGPSGVSGMGAALNTKLGPTSGPSLKSAGASGVGLSTSPKGSAMGDSATGPDKKPWWGFAGQTKGDALANASMFAPALFNIGRGLFGKTKQYRKHYNPTARKAVGILGRRRYTPDFTEERLATNKLTQDVRQNVGSSASRIAALTGARSALNRGIRSEMRRAANINNQLKGQYAQALSNYGRGIQGENIRNQMLGIRADAAKDRMLTTGLSQLGAAGMKSAEYMNRRKEMKERHELLGEMYPQYTLPSWQQYMSPDFNPSDSIKFRTSRYPSDLDRGYDDLINKIDAISTKLGLK